MGWATHHISKLYHGEIIEFRPKGGSMSGLIENNDLVKVIPRGEYEPQKGDIVLCKVQQNEYLHKVTAIKPGMVQISNNRNYVNGWAPLKNVYGICIEVAGRVIKDLPTIDNNTTTKHA